MLRHVSAVSLVVPPGECGPRAARAPSPARLAVARACDAMGGKAKPTKHTTAEINRKVAEATTNKGGGAAGLADRKGGSAGHSKFKCHICAQSAPDLKVCCRPCLLCAPLH
jgi:hypothetical protein